MKRKQLLHLLHSYFPHDPEEIAHKEEMLSFINNHERCFDRSLGCGHITASAWLLNRDKTKALLMHHAKLGRWFQLGGHCDGDPDVLSVSIREAQEESGVQNIASLLPSIFDIDIHLIPANKNEAEHYHYDVRFLLCITSDEAVTQSHESNQLLWIGIDPEELPTQERSVVRMFHKWKNYL